MLNERPIGKHGYKAAVPNVATPQNREALLRLVAKGSKNMKAAASGKNWKSKQNAVLNAFIPKYNNLLKLLHLKEKRDKLELNLNIAHNAYERELAKLGLRH